METLNTSLEPSVDVSPTIKPLTKSHGAQESMQKTEEEVPKRKRVAPPGAMRGQIHISDDFDDPLELTVQEVVDLMR